MSVPDHDADEQIVWQGKYITAKTRGRWEYVGRPRNIRAAVILAVDEHDHVLLGCPCIELPAGLIGDEADLAEEDPLVAAGRELEEETGYRAAILEDQGCFWSSPGMVSESFTLVRARQLTKVGQGGGVAGENITVHRVALADIQSFIAAKRADGCGIDVRMLLLLGQGLLAGE